MMAVPEFFLTIEESALSLWVRDNPFWAILTIHAIGMALLVGASMVIALRLLGVARDPAGAAEAIVWIHLAGILDPDCIWSVVADRVSHQVVYQFGFLSSWC
jgi:hypothetical protein